MLQLAHAALPATTATKLADYQGDVDSAGDYESRVAAAKTKFSAKNKATDPVFKIVRQKLREMCGVLERCVYCEDSYADEVEHIAPKDLYPEQVFDWMNYVYSCGPCNGPKNNKYAVLPPRAREPVIVTRERNAPIVPPREGTPALLNPRVEDPMEYVELDLAGTFQFVAVAAPGTRDAARAEYTIELLALNSRDVLSRARRNAFGTYRARLLEYRQAKNDGASAAQLQDLRDSLSIVPHPTVWREMQRQHEYHPDLKVLFDDVPEALTW